MKLNSVQACTLLFGAMLLLGGCQSKQGGDDVMASVDGRKIYRNDVEKYYQNQTAGSDQQPIAEQATSLRLGILKELIDDEILMHRAEKLGLLATDEEVNHKLSEIKSPYSQEQFDQKLKEKKITVDDFKRDLRRSLTVEKVINKEITSKINISDQDIADTISRRSGSRPSPTRRSTICRTAKHRMRRKRARRFKC